MILRGKGKDSGIVLVVDPHTSKILSSCFRMHDLLESGVLVLQNLCVTREKLPDLPAVYFVEPTAEAMEIIIEDFPAPPPPPPPLQHKEGLGAGAVIAGAAAALGEKISHVVHGGGGHGSAAAAAQAAAQPKPKCQYLCAHLFFTRAVHPSQMKLLQRPHSIDMRRVRSFVELGLDFIAAESKVFLFDQPHWIQRLYPIPDPEEEEDDEDPVPNPSNQALMPLVRQLISVCLTALPVGEMPYVRHISESLGIGKTHVSKQFAELFDREMNKTLKATAAAAAEAAAAAAQAQATQAAAAHAAAVAALPPGAVAPPPPVPPPAPAPPAAVPRNTTVLIVDRSLDPLTPLLHEFTFQAMLNDLLKVHGEIAHLPPPPDSAASASATPSAPASGAPAAAAAALIVGKDSDRESGELVLSEDDALWLEYRHKHIGEGQEDMHTPKARSPVVLAHLADTHMSALCFFCSLFYACFAPFSDGLRESQVEGVHHQQ